VSNEYVDLVKRLVPGSFPGRARLGRAYRAWTEPTINPSEARLQAFRERYFADVPLDLPEGAPIDARKLPSSGPFAWLDQPDALLQVDERVARNELTEEEASWCRSFARDGFAILPRAIEHETLDRVWAKYEEAVASGRLHPSGEKKTADDPHPGHVMNGHTEVPEIYEAFAHWKVMHAVELLVGKEMVPFQTLVFPKGREQLAHSDSIHMTTYPLGYMCASWIAFEDIHPDAGPLFYYPGSHRLPYVFSKDIGLTPQEFRARRYAAVEEKYEPFIQRMISASRIERKTFIARKGDVLVWHANLVHGGSPRTDVRPSRRSMACHYFAHGAYCFHDLSGASVERMGQRSTYF
jgi:hypothetical protein